MTTQTTTSPSSTRPQTCAPSTTASPRPTSTRRNRLPARLSPRSSRRPRSSAAWPSSSSTRCVVKGPRSRRWVADPRFPGRRRSSTARPTSSSTRTALSTSPCPSLASRSRCSRKSPRCVGPGSRDGPRLRLTHACHPFPPQYGSVEWTLWDRFELKGNPTMQEVVDYFQVRPPCLTFLVWSER